MIEEDKDKRAAMEILFPTWNEGTAVPNKASVEEVTKILGEL